MARAGRTGPNLGFGRIADIPGPGRQRASHVPLGLRRRCCFPVAQLVPEGIDAADQARSVGVNRARVDIATWSGFAILLLLIVALGAGTGAAAQWLAAISILVLAIHAVVALGWAEAAVFAAACLTITFALENVGATTGFPFGRYAFLVGAGLPHIGVIPIIVGPLYFGMGYASWVIANLLIGSRVARPQTRYTLVAVPLVAAFVMTQWDVVMDPSGSTLGKAWGRLYLLQMQMAVL